MNQAFQEFYDHSFKPAYRFFYYKNVNHSQIEDLVQDAFLRFYQTYQHKLESLYEARKILLGICLNVYREWVRTQMAIGNTWEYLEEADWEEEKASFQEYSDPDYDNQMEKRKVLLRQSLAELSGTVRQVLELRFLSGLTRRQTAEKLEISEDQVHTYQKRGVKYLKDILNKEAVLDDQVFDIEPVPNAAKPDLVQT